MYIISPLVWLEHVCRLLRLKRRYRDIMNTLVVLTPRLVRWPLTVIMWLSCDYRVITSLIVSPVCSFSCWSSTISSPFWGWRYFRAESLKAVVGQSHWILPCCNIAFDIALLYSRYCHAQYYPGGLLYIQYCPAVHAILPCRLFNIALLYIQYCPAVNAILPCCTCNIALLNI